MLSPKSLSPFSERSSDRTVASQESVKKSARILFKQPSICTETCRAWEPIHQRETEEEKQIAARGQLGVLSAEKLRSALPCPPPLLAPAPIRAKVSVSRRR